MASSKRYLALSQDESDCDDKHIQGQPLRFDQGPRRWFRSRSLLSTALLVSLSLNVFFVFQQLQLNHHVESAEPLSRYARLARDVPTVRMYNTSYDNPDRAVENAAWGAPEMQPENGFVALDDSYSESMGLPHSMRSPWFDDKGIYVLASAHELHCVHVLRDAINQAHDGEPVVAPHHHVMHCLDVLRETVMCNADDTPLYKGRLHSQAHTQHPRAGVGSMKMCRSWTKLQAWARERSSCWRPYKLDDPNFKEIDRYKFCPDGSKPWERLENKKEGGLRG